MSTSNSNTYLDLLADNLGSGSLSSINVWWSATEPERVHFVVADSRLTDEHGEKPGLRLVFSANPKSADYNPANFNRCARMLRAAGKPAPDADVPEHKRHLRYRDALLGSLSAPAAPVELGTLPSDAEICPNCSAYVADLSSHKAALH